MQPIRMLLIAAVIAWFSYNLSPLLPPVLQHFRGGLSVRNQLPPPCFHYPSVGLQHPYLSRACADALLHAYLSLPRLPYSYIYLWLCFLKLCFSHLPMPPFLKMMDIEDIDDNSSQDDCPQAKTATATTKKRTKSKSKKESPAASSTLTRFLGPAGPPSFSAWEDVNRQCPVCQQTGFSSRSLALHVNECLDMRSNAGAVPADGEGEAASPKKERASKGAGTTGGRNALADGSAQREGNVGTNNESHGDGAGNREGVARKMPQVVPPKSRTPVRHTKAAKKAKTYQDRPGTAGGRQTPGACMCVVALSIARYAILL